MSEVLLTIGGKPVHGRRAPCGPRLLPRRARSAWQASPQCPGRNRLPKCDGTTDDYANIMKAVPHYQTGGFAKQSLFFPAGRYRVSQPIFLDQ
jgi:hypothetical protein